MNKNINIKKEVLLVSFFIYLILTLIIVSCTNKNTQIGIGDSNVKSHDYITFTSIFEEVTTFVDREFTLRNNEKLIVGNTARTLIRFDSLPDVDVLDNIINDPILTLYIKHIENFNLNNLRAFPLKNNLFNENNANWDYYDLDKTWANQGGDFDENFDFIIRADTTFIEIKIDWSVVRDWITKPDNYNLGVVLKSNYEDTGFVEFYSRMGIPTTNRPTITFQIENDEEYENEDQDEEELSIVRLATHNTFIHNIKGENLDTNVLNFSNIPPSSIFTKFNIRYEDLKVFYETDLAKRNIFSDEDWKNIIISRAVLRFHIDRDKNEYLIDEFRIIGAVPRLEVPRTEDGLIDLEFVKTPENLLVTENLFLVPFVFPPQSPPINFTSFTSLVARNYIDIDIKGHLQNMISNTDAAQSNSYRPNNGIFLFNDQINRDFGRVSFHSQPELRIWFSTLIK
jgi:hypothetical protein